MGPLHGGNDNCENDDLMYFTNINYEPNPGEGHKAWLQSIDVDKVSRRKDRSVDEL